MSALPQPNQLPVEYLSELFDRDETRDPTYRTRGAQFTLGHETSQNQVAVNFGSGIIAFVAAISPQQPVRFPFHFNLTNVPHVVEIETVSTALEPILITERELASLEKKGSASHLGACYGARGANSSRYRYKLFKQHRPIFEGTKKEGLFAETSG